MSLNEALELVDPKWEEEFKTFVETGDASDEFFAFLDSNDDCQKAVDRILKQKSEGLERVSALLRSKEFNGRGQLIAVPDKSALLAKALKRTARLPTQERTQVLKEAVATVQHAMPDTRPFKTFASELAREVDLLEK